MFHGFNNFIFTILNNRDVSVCAHKSFVFVRALQLPTNGKKTQHAKNCGLFLSNCLIFKYLQYVNKPNLLIFKHLQKNVPFNIFVASFYLLLYIIHSISLHHRNTTTNKKQSKKYKFVSFPNM